MGDYVDVVVLDLKVVTWDESEEHGPTV